jgi:hypothetical protein
MAIIADRCYGRKRGGASACADIEQSRVRNAIVPVSRYHCAASLQKISAAWLTQRQIMRGILFELPHTIPEARRTVETSSMA